MALNCSQRPIFPSHLSEDSLVSPMRITNGFLMEGIQERGGEGCIKPWQKCHEIEDCFDYVERDNKDGSVSLESSSKDIIDLLPSDPFGMDISTTFTAITGWLEDLEINCGGYEIINGGDYGGEYDLFGDFNFIWNSAAQFQDFPSKFRLYEKSDFTLRDMPKSVFPQIVEEKEDTKNASCEGDDGSPHPGLFYALSCLGIRDLLSVERVCKMLHSTVKSDSLLWRNIHIQQPLHEKIGDDILVKLAARAQGNLQSLSLVNCHRITDDGLRTILDANPRLTKLCVPGCTRLSVEGVVNNLKDFNSKNTPGIKQLRIGGCFVIENGHFQELKLLLGVNGHIPQNEVKPIFYHERDHFLSCDDNRAIDIETCPNCQKSRLVYDCPYKCCQEKRGALQACRGCWLCIPRCHHCGRCVTDCEYEETFNFDLCCSGCKDGKDNLVLDNGSSSSVRG